MVRTDALQNSRPREFASVSDIRFILVASSTCALSGSLLPRRLQYIISFFRPVIIETSITHLLSKTNMQSANGLPRTFNVQLLQENSNVQLLPRTSSVRSPFLLRRLQTDVNAPYFDLAGPTSTPSTFRLSKSTLPSSPEYNEEPEFRAQEARNESLLRYVFPYPNLALSHDHSSVCSAAVDSATARSNAKTKYGPRTGSCCVNNRRTSGELLKVVSRYTHLLNNYEMIIRN